MASNGHSQANGMDGRVSEAAHRPKPLTIVEALPYSPLSSIAPFNSAIIPTPTIGTRSSTSFFANDADRSAARLGLESLNREAVDSNGTSARLAQTLRDLQDLLRPEGLTEYKFKTMPAAPGSRMDLSKDRADPQVSLTPFSQMLYDTTTVAFNYPTPDSPTPRGTNGLATPPAQPKVKKQSKAKAPPAPSPKPLSEKTNKQTLAPAPAPMVATQTETIAGKAPPPPKRKHSKQLDRSVTVSQDRTPDSVSENRTLQSATPVTPVPPPQPKVKKNEPQTSSKPPPKKVSPPIERKPTPVLDPAVPLSVSVIIPSLPNTFKPDEYVVVPDAPPTPPALSKKRKRTDYEEDESPSARGPDQIEKADAAFRDLQDYLQIIFEAEDQINPGDGLSDGDRNLFVLTDENEISMSLQAHTKLDPLIQKTITLGRFSKVPIDDLTRLQRLCEGALRATETADIKIDSAWAEDDVALWLGRLSQAQVGIRSARTLLRMMTRSREERQIYSEELISLSLNAFRNVIDSCIVPVVELRASGSESELFRLIAPQKKAINSVLSQCGRLLARFGEIVSCIELPEIVTSSLEYAATQLIFVENARSEKDSVLGVQRYDSFRVTAMDVIGKIFLRLPQHRAGIINEILTSLEKLPSTKQSARHFKLAGGGDIQLVSALLMQLVQTSASRDDEGKGARRDRAMAALENGDGFDGSAKPLKQQKNSDDLGSEIQASEHPETAVQSLRNEVSPLLAAAEQNAHLVATYLVKRAMNSTKQDEIRALLDLFVADFNTCLGSPDWPAAELFLRYFLLLLLQLANNEKSTVKNMALELLATMASAISEMNRDVKRTISSVDQSNNELGTYLSQLAETSLEGRVSTGDLITWDGVYRMTLEHLSSRSLEDSQLHSAVTYLIADWASKICKSYDEMHDSDDQKAKQELGRLAYRLQMMVRDRKWLTAEYSFNAVETIHARLAYTITLLNSQFFNGAQRILSVLLGSMTSDQAHVRSKSLRSVNEVLKNNPALLDRDNGILHQILSCSTDVSVQVRDSALDLIGTCIELRPSLQADLYGRILERFSDQGKSVRRRAIELAKLIYLRNQNKDIRSDIAGALLLRVLDPETNIQEIAWKAIEEVWMSPFYTKKNSAQESSAHYKLAMEELAALMVRTVQHGNGVSTVLDKVLQNMLSKSSSHTSDNLGVCRNLVSTLFDSVIDNSAGNGSEVPNARNALEILTIFAKANPDLIPFDQMKHLMPYLENVRDGDDRLILRSVVVIFRHVFPKLPTTHIKVVTETRTKLLHTLSKLPRALIDDVMACLHTISEVTNNKEHIARVAMSSLAQLVKIRGLDFSERENLLKLSRLSAIAGMAGKHFDLDEQREVFEKQLKNLKGNSVAELMISAFVPYAQPERSEDVRKAALDAIGLVCQSWPANFRSPQVYTVLQEIFRGNSHVLQKEIMKSIKEYFIIEEKRSGENAEATASDSKDQVATLGVMGGAQHDGVAIDITQRYVDDIARIALSTQGENALLATELLGSINRQGAVHPKQYVSALVALETSPDSKIRDIVVREHHPLHSKRETMLVKEYPKAVYVAFEYQRDIIGDIRGATANPYTAKLSLLMEVLATSKSKARRNFFDTLCARVDFEPLKLDASQDQPPHVQFSQFIIENLAFFEYQTVDELLGVISAMEKVVAGTGTSVAHSIETEIFQIGLNLNSQQDGAEGQEPDLATLAAAVQPARLRQLTACSMILSSLWEARSHLRRLYGLQNNIAGVREKRSKLQSKDFSKAPVKAAFGAGDKMCDNFWEANAIIMASLDSSEAMMDRCRAFVELLNVDQDFKISSAEGEDELARIARGATPSDDEADGTPSTQSGHRGRGRPRKNPLAPAGTPSKKRKARSGSRTRGPGRPPKRSSADRDSVDADGDWE